MVMVRATLKSKFVQLGNVNEFRGNQEARPPELLALVPITPPVIPPSTPPFPNVEVLIKPL
jgi:hypothetical protein